MSEIAIVRPLLMRTVPSAGEPGGELAVSSSSCNRYLTGEKAFLGLDICFCVGEGGCCRSEGIEGIGEAAAMISEILRGGSCLLSGYSGMGNDREFCFDGDRSVSALLVDMAGYQNVQDA